MDLIPASWRLFVAVELSREAIDELLHRQHAVNRWARSGDVRFSNRQSLHLTVRFIGNVAPDTVPALVDELTTIASQSRRLSLRLSANGCFPGPRTPRILWTGLTGDEYRLDALISAVSGGLARLGIGEDVRRFVPHITLARVRVGIPKFVLEDIGDAWIENDTLGCDVPVRRLTLFRSHLKRGVPPRYERLARCKLAD